MKRMVPAGATLTDRFMAAGIKRETLGKVCMALFLCMILPLVIIALYNYPADDDFFYSLEAARGWVNTGSLSQVIQGVIERVGGLYDGWQGNFAHATIVACSPLIFNINLYFLANWFVLAMLCLSLYALCKTLVVKLLGSDRWTLWVVYTCLMVLILQFIPAAAEGLYWHSGAAYTIEFAIAVFVLNGLLRGELAKGRVAGIVRTALLFLGAFVVGGCHFVITIGMLVLLTLLCLREFIVHGKNRLRYVLTLLGLLAGLVLCLAAPGNAARQEATGESMGVIYTLVHSVGESLDYLGKTLTPQLLAMSMLIVPVLWKPLKESRYAFRYPLLVLVLLYGVFASTFAPGIYATNSLVAGRYENIVYFFAIMVILFGLAYAEGWLIRRLQRNESTSATLEVADKTLGGTRFTALYLAICVALLALGGFGYTIMNTTSVSATKSLVTGEAARFRQEMEERAEYIRVTDSDVVQVKVLENQPYVFKKDRLPFQGIYGRVRYMKWYYELFYNAEHGITPQEE